MKPIGHRRWAIAEGYIPGASHGPKPQMTSHETACLLNAGNEAAQVEITVFFRDREPAEPFAVNVPPRRTLHLRFNGLTEPDLPRDADYSSLIESNVRSSSSIRGSTRARRAMPC